MRGHFPATAVETPEELNGKQNRMVRVFLQSFIAFAMGGWGDIFSYHLNSHQNLIKSSSGIITH